jgi:hypothetical protein
MERSENTEAPVWVDPLFVPLPGEQDSAERNRTPTCLSLSRARELALNSVRWTSPEEAHARECRRCERLVQQFTAEMPHLSVWLLIRRRLGMPLLDSEVHSIRYHLDEGGCSECAERDRKTEELLPNVALLKGMLPRPLPEGVHAADAGVPDSAAAAAGAFEAELALERGQLGLEVRTRDPRWQRQLVGWTLATRREREACERFAVLHPDVEGWFVDHSWLDAKDLGLGTQNPCQEILAAAVDVELLTREQREALVEVVRRLDLADQRGAWQAWALEQQEREDLSPQTHEVLARILQYTPE